MWKLPEILNVSSTFNFETNFTKNANPFQKTEVLFLAKTTKIKKAIFPYKTALSKAYFKKNRMRSTKWTYHK